MVQEIPLQESYDRSSGKVEKSLHDLKHHQSYLYLLINVNIGSSSPFYPRCAETHI